MGCGWRVARSFIERALVYELLLQSAVQLSLQRLPLLTPQASRFHCCCCCSCDCSTDVSSQAEGLSSGGGKQGDALNEDSRSVPPCYKAQHAAGNKLRYQLHYTLTAA